MNRRLSVIGAISPVTRDVDGQIAIDSIDGSGLKTGFARVWIDDGQCTAGFQQGIEIGVDIFGNRTGVSASDNRRSNIGNGDGAGHAGGVVIAVVNDPGNGTVTGVRVVGVGVGISNALERELVIRERIGAGQG